VHIWIGSALHSGLWKLVWRYGEKDRAILGGAGVIVWVVDCFLYALDLDRNKLTETTALEGSTIPKLVCGAHPLSHTGTWYEKAT